MGPNSFCCQCGGWEGCPQPWALQEHRMSHFHQHSALAVRRMLVCTSKSLNSSAFGVLCCQGQLLSLCIVLLCDPTHKLFLSTPQWIADRNKPNFMSVWRVCAHWLHAHHGSHLSHAVHQQCNESSWQQQHSPNCSRELELNTATHYLSSPVAAEVCSAPWCTHHRLWYLILQHMCC